MVSDPGGEGRMAAMKSVRRKLKKDKGAGEELRRARFRMESWTFAGGTGCSRWGRSQIWEEEKGEKKFLLGRRGLVLKRLATSTDKIRPGSEVGRGDATSFQKGAALLHGQTV